MANVVVDVQSGEVTELLAQLKERTQNTKPAMEAVGRYLLYRIQMGFRTSRDPWGEAWKPPKFRFGQPLRDTGRLRNSISYQAADEEVTVGTNLKYAAVHQFGAVITPKNKKRLVFEVRGIKIFARKVTIPARPFMPIGKPLPESWEQGVKDTITRAIVAASDGAP